MTKPVPLNEQDVKCCLTRVKPLLCAESSLLQAPAGGLSAHSSGGATPFQRWGYRTGQ